jgi:SAM-dependent methyltransferase
VQENPPAEAAGSSLVNEQLTEFGAVRPTTGKAYHVDPSRRELYSLRQARYQALAFDIQRLAGEFADRGATLKLLDIGVGSGTSRRYLEAWPNSKFIEFCGADIRLRERFRPDGWSKIWIGDLTQGYPDIPSDTFDVVVCEQVLEHLPQLDVPLRTLARTLRPGGTLFVGVPIFPPGIRWARSQLARVAPKEGGHVQTFSRRTFTTLLRDTTGLDIVAVRGFRVMSGGLLRPLENYRWWWRFNRWLGERIPGWCTEIQVIARKPAR